jgi:4-amino-4-deoxychorismate lyase
MHTLINGVASDCIAVMDRGLHYGDGVFETILYRNTQLEFWMQHMQRLQQGAARLQLACPTEDVWRADIAQLLRAQADRDCVIKIIITRGPGQRGYRHPQPTACTRIVMLTPYTASDIANCGAHIRFCKTMISHNPALAGIKHLNRLDNVLARNEWQDDYDEGLMLDHRGCVIEATMSNVVAVKQGRLYTPRLTDAGIHGIIRQQLLALAARHDIACAQIDMQPGQLLAMDELMLTNSVIGLWPVVQLDTHSYAIGTMTRRLQALLNQSLVDHAITPA